MMTMELLQSLTTKIIQLHNTPKYLFWKTHKLEKDIKDLQNKIRGEDIFRISGAALSYLISTIDTKEYICTLELDKNYISWTITNMQINLAEGETTIIFNPRLNRFDIVDEDKSYTIYRNTSVPKMLQTDWNILCDKMKNTYLDAVDNITASKFIA